MMRKKRLLLLPLLAAPTWLMAQTPADSVARAENEDMESYVFSDYEIDDEAPNSQTATSLATYNDDMFLSKTNYRFGHSYFSAHNYDQQYHSYTVNGARINDVESGVFRFSSLFGGLSDASRNQQGVTSYEQNTINYMDIGGGSDINVRASQFAAGNKATLSLTNRNYIGRVMFTHATGLRNGWAFAATGGFRYGEEGNMKGTYLKSAALMLAAERVFNYHHALSLSLIAAPTDQATSSWTTEEAYWLANSHYYNPFWGWQNGKKRSSRVRKTIEPTAFLTWDWTLNEKTKLTTTNIFRYAKYGQTFINRTNNAADPRPDYYHNMPSSIFDIYGAMESGMAPSTYWQYEEWLSYVNYWRSSEHNRQIDWDKMYMINQNSVKDGGEAVYYLEEAHNDQFAWNFSTAFDHIFNKSNRLNAGINLNHTTALHYKTMADLLGANFHTDIDRFASSDYGYQSPEAQNDLDHPNRRIRKGDKFGYNYNILVNKAQLWSTYTYDYDNLSVIFSGNINGTTIERDGKMLNGRSPEHSKGSSGTAKFLSGGAKAQVGYTINAHHKFFLSAGYEMRPPIANNSFLDPQIKNDFVPNLQNENVIHAEATYRFGVGRFNGQIRGYFTQFDNQVEQTQFFDDIEEEYSYLTMTGIRKRHYGGELALEYRFNSNFSADFVGSYGDAKYINNADAVIIYDNAADPAHAWDNTNNMPLKVITKDMKVGCTPLTALSLGLKYNISGWFFEARLNYYDRSYIYFSPYLRLSDMMPRVTHSYNAQGQPVWAVDRMQGGILLDESGNIVDYVAKEQQKFDDAFMLDLSIGKFIRLKHGHTMSINLNLTNLTNNTNMVLRGREENRSDYYNMDKYSGDREKVKQYKFGYNPKIAYAYPFNAFLNVNYKF